MCGAGALGVHACGRARPLCTAKPAGMADCDGKPDAGCQVVKAPEAEAGGGPAIFSLFEDDELPEGPTTTIGTQRSRDSWKFYLLWLSVTAVLTAGGAIYGGWRAHHAATTAVTAAALGATGDGDGSATGRASTVELEELEAKLVDIERRHQQLASASSTTAGVEPCYKNAVVDPKTGTVQLQHCNTNDTISVPLQPSPAGMQSDQSGQSGSSCAADGTCFEADDVRPMEFPDLTCAETPFREWLEVKVMLKEYLGKWSSSIVRHDEHYVASLAEMLQASADLLKPVNSEVNECGMGRLCMTLLALGSGAGDGHLESVPSIHSPLLTVLLEYPWDTVMQSGWPFFALLSQLHVHSRQNRPIAFDMPTHGYVKAYFDALGRGLEQQNWDGVRLAGANFLIEEDEARKRSVTPDQNRMAELCAIVSQQLSRSPQGSMQNSVLHLQTVFRQAVRHFDDLQVTLHSAWPLYGLLHAVALLQEREGLGPR